MMDAYNNARTKESIPDLKKDVLSVVEHDEEDEADEPLLVENKNRFVLFPIKYHEVCHENLLTFTRKKKK